MRLKVTALVLLTALTVSTAASQKHNLTTGTEEVTVEKLNLTLLEERFNQNTDQVPGFVGSLIGDQTIALNLSGVDEGEHFLENDTVGIKTEGKQISNIQWGEYNQTTLRIWIYQENLERLSDSNQPLQELKTMLKNEDIRYETYTFTNSIKMSLMRIFLGL